MRRPLLLTAFLACATGAMAQNSFDSIDDVEEVEIPSGAFYLKTSIYENAAEQTLFLSRGASWGTEATVDRYGLPIAYNSETKAISFYDWANTRMFSDDGSSVYTDGATSKTTTYEFIRRPYSNFQVLVKVLPNGKFLGVDKGDYGYYVHLVDSASAIPFEFVTKDVHDKILSLQPISNNYAVAASAGIENLDPDLLLSDKTYFDKYLADNYATTDLSSLIDPSGFTFTAWRRNSNANKTAVELYQGTGTFTQTLTGLKPGIYKVTFHGFERNGSNADQVTLGNEGYELTTTYLDANGQTVQFPSWYSDRTDDGNPNGISQAVALFNQGKYEAGTYAYVSEDSTLNLKVVAPSYKGGHWVMFNNWGLQYYSNTMSDEDAQDALDKASQLLEFNMEKTAHNALIEAYETFSSEQTIANFNTLSAATAAAENSAKAYSEALTALESMKKLMENEQAVSAEALAEYKAAYETAWGKYTEGELTTAEASGLENPYKTYGWHTTGLAFDKYLCSGWNTNPNYVDAPYYINTWSVEGETDGSEFKVPFYEYFVGSGSLAARTMVATIPVEDAEYQYEVSLWVRGQQDGSNTIDPSAITFTTNKTEENAESLEGGNESLVAGYIFKEVKVLADPDENGQITLNINVGENSNIHWLSWKNVKVTKTSTPTGVKAIENNTTSTVNGTVYNLAGQKLNGMQKGLNIQNGKKVLVK